jgi:hypothetical protein
MKLNKAVAVPAIALAAGLGLAACQSSSAAPAKPAATSSAAAAAAPAPTTPAPTTPAAPQTLLNFTGHGNESTSSFTSSGDFSVSWSVTGNTDTSSGTAIPDNFMIDMYTAGTGDDMMNFNPVNDIQSTDSGNQTVSSDDGSHYFTVQANTASTWTIKVVTAP